MSGARAINDHSFWAGKGKDGVVLPDGLVLRVNLVYFQMAHIRQKTNLAQKVLVS